MKLPRELNTFPFYRNTEPFKHPAMKNLQFIADYSPQDLREMLAEAERAKKLIEDNPETPLTAQCGYCLAGDEILTLEYSLTSELVRYELELIINLIREELNDEPNA